MDVPHLVISEIRTPPPPPISVTAGGCLDEPGDGYLNLDRRDRSVGRHLPEWCEARGYRNDGVWSRQIAAGTHTFRVCERLSTTVCSTDVTVVPWK